MTRPSIPTSRPGRTRLGGGPEGAATHYRLRPQADLEARLLDLIEQLSDVDHTNPERVSWHVGQIAALLFTLGAEEWVSVDVAYRLWVGRNDNSSQEEG